MKIFLIFCMLLLFGCESEHVKLNKNLYSQIYLKYNNATLADFLNENDNEIKQTTLFIGNRIIYYFKDNFYVEIYLVDMPIESNKSFKYNEREDFKIKSMSVYSKGIHSIGVYEYKDFLHINFVKN